MTDSVSTDSSPRHPAFRRGGAAALAAAVAAVLLAGCGGSSDASAGAANTLSIGWGADPAPRGYDPLLYSANQRFFFETLYQSLFVTKADGSVAPGLVNSFTYNATKTELTLKLKSGITFTDGSKLTAQLVKANLDRRNDSKLVSYGAFAAKGAAEITSVSAANPSTVVLKFAAPQATFETQLAGTAGMIVGQKGVSDPQTLATTPDGSGAYRLSNSGTTKGSSYTVERVPAAGKAGHPFQKVVYKLYNDAQALANSVVTGQVDLAIVDPSTASFVQSRGIAMVKNGGTVLSMPVFDKKGTTVKAFADKRVRLALDYAIDRSSFVGALHKGSHPTVNAFPQSSAGYDPALETKYAYDPAMAKKLLAEAGYAKGLTFNMVTSPNAKADLEALQKQFQAVGVTMNIKVTTALDEIYSAVATQPLGYLPIGWTNEVGVTAGVLVGGFANTQKASDPVIDKALAAASNAQGSTRPSALKALNDALVDEGWIIPIAEQYNYVGYNAKKLAAPVFPGLDITPLFTSLKPAS